MNSWASAWAQGSYQVPLGAAAEYGLLSADGITAQAVATGSAIPIQAFGKAGSALAISAGVAATDGVFAAGSGTVGRALSDLAAARSYCTSQGGTSLNAALGGQTLGAAATW